MNLIQFNHNENEFNILHWLRNKPSKRTGLYPIYCRITLNGIRATEHGFSTGVNITKDIWHAKSQTIVLQDNAHKLQKEQAQVHNDRLMRIKIDIQKVFANFELAGNPFTALDIQNAYLGKPSAPAIHTLRELVNEWQARFTQYVELNEKAPRTLETYESYNKMILAHFGEDKSLKDFNTNHFEEFRLVLRSQTITRGQNMGQTKGINYASKILKHFAKLFELAHEKEWINRTPYQYSKAQRVKPALISLSAEKLHELEKQVLEDKLDKAKDIFLFCAYTGFSYKDYCALTSKNLINVAGEEFIFIEYRLKSPLLKRYGRSYAPIFEKTKALIAKYGSIENLPRLDNCNVLLKYIWGKIDAPRNVSLKNARHTFINYAKGTLGYSIEDIATMVGHSSIRTTQESYLDHETYLQTLISNLKNRNS